MHTSGLIILELNPSEDSGMGRGRSGGWGGEEGGVEWMVVLMVLSFQGGGTNGKPTYGV